MTAIVTDPFKKQLLQRVFDEVRLDSARYYLGIGRSEQWDASETVPTPLDTPRQIRNARSSMQSVKSAADVSFVIPRYNWSSGAIYQAYDDNFSSIPLTNSYYVLTEENQVYICLKQARNSAGVATTSTVKPSGTSTKPFKTLDGYVWKFLYSLSSTRASAFLSANFVPVEKILTTAELGRAHTSLEAEQFAVQNAKSPGQVLGVKVIEGGSGYNNGTRSLTIVGDGTGATCTGTVEGNTFTKIELDSSADSTMKMGGGYNFVSVAMPAPDIGGGTQATSRVILGPDSGMGADARDELKSTSLMFNTKPDGTEGGKFVVDNDFRQVTLMRNPLLGRDSNFTGTASRVLKFLKVTSSTDAATLTVDKTITGANSGAVALVVEVLTDQVYYYQNETTGFKPFEEAEVINGGAGGSATLEAAGADLDTDAFDRDSSDIINTTGQVLYIENRAPVIRGNLQKEDIKIVLTL